MVLAANTPINTYQGAGTTNSFPFTFSIFNGNNLLITVSSPNLTEILQVGIDYTVSGISTVGQPATAGTITLINTGQQWLSGGNLANGWTLTITSNNPFAQTYSFRNGGDFYRTGLENALDYQMMCIQQLVLSGLTITDIVTETQWRLIMVNGVLSQIPVT